MFETIVVGVDGRSGGADALAHAQGLAEHGARLVLVSVAVVPDAAHAAEGARGYAAASMLAAEHALAVQQAEVPELEGEVRMAPSVADGLRQAARHHHADAIVIGSAVRGLANPDAGAHGDAIRDAAPCTVVVVPPRHVAVGGGLAR